jgi:hypothetical protein
MYKTIWLIQNGEIRTQLAYYHFGKELKFPTWYMEADAVYEIEMIWNLKLVCTPKTFFKCLFHKYKERRKK